MGVLVTWWVLLDRKKKLILLLPLPGPGVPPSDFPETMTTMDVHMSSIVLISSGKSDGGTPGPGRGCIVMNEDFTWRLLATGWRQ